MLDDVITVFDCSECRALNDALVEEILRLPDKAFNQRTHMFHGRYENLYIDADKLQGLGTVLDKGLSKAAEILSRPKNDIKVGFWLNIMNQGDVTTLHRHDDDDELLSAVYYVQSDENSAMFRMYGQGKEKNEVKEIAPVAGRFMFFDPAVPHEVTEHKVDIPRISIGINFGPTEINSN